VSRHKDEEAELDKIVEWAHQRDGVIEVRKTEKVYRVLSYEEVARRLQARPKNG